VCGAHCVQYPVIGAHSIAAGMSGVMLISRDSQGSGFGLMDVETDENRANLIDLKSHVRVEVEASCLQTFV
jgi:hypothetical protein